MGYTHYWTPAKSVSLEKRKAMVEFTKEAIALSGVEIGAWDGEGGKPILNTKTINFNGVGDDSHENFSPFGKDWNFCKTARKPYDKVVVACLMYADEIGVIAEWSSDGDGEDHIEGLDLMMEVLKNSPED